MNTVCQGSLQVGHNMHSSTYSSAAFSKQDCGLCLGNLQDCRLCLGNLKLTSSCPKFSLLVCKLLALRPGTQAVICMVQPNQQWQKSQEGHGPCCPHFFRPPGVQISTIKSFSTATNKLTFRACMFKCSISRCISRNIEHDA